MGFVLLLSYSYFDKPRARTCFRYGQICVSIARDTFSPDLTGFISPRSLVYHIDTREEKCISTLYKIKKKKEKKERKREKKKGGNRKEYNNVEIYYYYPAIIHLAALCFNENSSLCV